MEINVQFFFLIFIGKKSDVYANIVYNFPSHGQFLLAQLWMWNPCLFGNSNVSVIEKLVFFCV